MENKQKALEFLQDKFIMEIATAINNKPSASVVLFANDNDLNFYFATHSDSYKAKHLMENPQISFVIWKHRQALLQADGVISVVSDSQEKHKIMDGLANATTRGDGFWPPLFRIEGGKYVVFKITPTWMRMLDLGVDTTKQEDSPFTEIKL